MARLSSFWFSLLTVLKLASWTTAFDNTRFDNVAVYWGQNSYGATHTDVANFQKTISFYCNDNAVDVFPIAFLNVFFGPGGVPEINLANTCNNVDNATFSGTSLANCQSLASDIETCQQKGKLVTISLGGATGGVGFQSDSQAQSFADQVWNLFLGGSSSTRPFGNAVLDGVDLDIEGGTSASYAAFVNQLRSHFSGASKKYIITAAPQCVFPDAALGGVLNTAQFDAIYVQFYNNPCGLQNFNSAANWNFGIWDGWARNTSPNKNVKVYIGAPASPTAAGSGYQQPATLIQIATQMRKSFPSFGGIMLWDESQAFANSRYDLAMKNALVAAGGTGFTFPPCSAPAFVQGTNYPGGSQVSFNGYIWEAKFFASNTPANDPNNEWSAISACQGGSGSGSGTSTTTVTAPSSKPPSSTSTTSNPSPTSGSCAGVPQWINNVAFNGGQQVVFNGHLWTAKWWTFADTPGGAAGVWTDDGPCSSANVGSTQPVIESTSTPKAKTQSKSEPATTKDSTTDAGAHPAKPTDTVRHSRFFRP